MAGSVIASHLDVLADREAVFVADLRILSAVRTGLGYPDTPYVLALRLAKSHRRW